MILILKQCCVQITAETLKRYQHKQKFNCKEYIHYTSPRASSFYRIMTPDKWLQGKSAKWIPLCLQLVTGWSNTKRRWMHLSLSRLFGLIVLSPSQQWLASITTTDQWCCGCLMSLWKQNKEDGVPHMDFHARQHHTGQSRSSTVHRCQCFCIQIALLGLLIQLCSLTDCLPTRVLPLQAWDIDQQMPECWRSTAVHQVMSIMAELWTHLGSLKNNNTLMFVLHCRAIDSESLRVGHSAQEE